MCGIAGVYGLEGIADAQGLAKGLTQFHSPPWTRCIQYVYG